LTQLPGGKEALKNHLQALGISDLSALRTGLLAGPGARGAILDQVDAPLRQYVGAILDQIMDGMAAREAGQAVAKPLSDMASALSSQPLDGQALHQALGRLSEGLAMLQGTGQDLLKTYLRELPDDELRGLVAALKADDQGSLDSLNHEPGIAGRDQDLLTRVREAVHGEARARLDDFSAGLAQSLSQALSQKSNLQVMQQQVWQSCVDQARRFDHHSASELLLTALSLPKAMTGLDTAQVDQFLQALPQPTFNELCKAYETASDSIKAKMLPRLETQNVMRQGAAAQEARAVKLRLDEAITRGDRGQVQLFANLYKDAIRTLRDTHVADQSKPPEEFTLSDDTLQRLKTDFGVEYDQVGLTVTLTLSESLRAKLAPHLEVPVPGMGGGDAPLKHTVTLPVDGVDTQFTVNASFFKDGIERSSVRLSIKGADPEGRDVDVSWPPGVSRDQHGKPMGNALHALQRIAGPMAEPLTRLMNQQMGAAILKGLQDMGDESPFKLPDGSVVLPVGAGQFDFRVEKLEDGSFKLNALMRIPIENAVKIDKTRGAMPVPMNPDTSWTEVSVSLVVAPDGLTIRDAEPPRVSYNFTTISE
jgi:hypothetical protein